MRSTVGIAYDWAVRCFGLGHVHNMRVRSLRVAEEAVELVQAVGLPKEKLHELIDVVYARPPGKFEDEIAGVLMTVNVLCAARQLDPDQLFEKELRRVLDKPAEHFTKRNQEKIDLGLVG